MSNKQVILGKVCLTPRGHYIATEPYNPLDIITYNGNSYLVLQEFTGIEPGGDNIYTLLLASKGEPGRSFEYTDFTEEQLTALKGEKGDQGDPLLIKGYFESEDELETAINEPVPGDTYGVGEAEPYEIYIYDGVSAAWKNNGILAGPAGRSAYESYLQGGGTLSEEEFNHVLAAIEYKIDSEEGKGLSTEDYTTPEKEKLSSLPVRFHVPDAFVTTTGEVTLEEVRSFIDAWLAGQDMYYPGYRFGQLEIEEESEETLYACYTLFDLRDKLNVYKVNLEVVDETVNIFSSSEQYTTKTDLSGYVTVDTDQEITGNKNFSGGVLTAECIHGENSIFVGENKKDPADGETGISLNGDDGSIALTGKTPYIDFYYGNSTEDYTSRIIENKKGELTIPGKLLASQGIGTTKNWVDNAKAFSNTYQLIDLTGDIFDENKWYPVVTEREIGNQHCSFNFVCGRTLNTSYGVPSYASHKNGFATCLDISTNTSGWGTIEVNTIIKNNSIKFVKEIVDGYNNPIGYTQMHQSNTIVFYLRGGSKYDMLNNANIGWKVVTDEFTTNKQTVTVMDSYPGISFSLVQMGTDYAKRMSRIGVGSILPTSNDEVTISPNRFFHNSIFSRNFYKVSTDWKTQSALATVEQTPQFGTYVTIPAIMSPATPINLEKIYDLRYTYTGAALSGTLALSGGIDGMEYVISVNNTGTGNLTINMPTGDSYQSNSNSLVIPLRKVGQIFIKYLFDKYIIRI